MFDVTKCILFFLISLIVPIEFNLLYAQKKQDYIIVDSIKIVGTVRTKDWVIRQEARIYEGDTLSFERLNKRIDEIKIDLKRTNLFSHVELTYQLEYTKEYHIVLTILLDENWLLFPAVIFEIADRNFNVWWKEQNHSFSRINVGAKLFHYNITGRKDRLRLLAHTGYTNKIEASYEYPFISKRYNIGLKISALYSQNKELVYKSIENKSLFFKDENNVIFQRQRYSISLRHRPNRRWISGLNIESNHNSIDTAVARQNPNYFLNGNSKQHFTSINYVIEYSTKDLNSRPKKGTSYSVQIEKIGIPGIEKYNLLHSIQKYSWTKPIARKVFYNINIQSKQAWIRHKEYPFNLYIGLGYNNDLVFGYEYYVIDGLDYFTIDNALRIPIFTYKKSFFKVLKGEPKIKIKMDFDYLVSIAYGYVNDPYYKEENQLSNTNLGSISTGLGLVVNEAINIRIQGSINHKMEAGLFIHSKSSF
ncbi:MAG: hypothetical protein IPH96_09115 [Saprospiraceae bacterium]|nr:hypothetical protein [Saprospiraceae bacterium]MBK9993858.1 hypothetical protein [Saprospiraceae bacterium]